MNNLAAKTKQLVLVLGDILMLYGALFLTLYLRYGAKWPQRWEAHFYPLTIIYFLWLLCFYIIGLYELKMARNNFYFFVTLGKSLIVNVFIASVFFYFIPNLGIAPKTNLFLNLSIFALLLTGWRQFFNYFIKASALLNNILIIGQSQETQELIKYIGENPQLGYRIKKIVEPKQVNILSDLTETIVREKIQTVVTTINPRKSGALVRNLYQCIPLKIALAELPAFYETVTGKIPVSAIEEVWFLENLMAERKLFFEGIKRGLDILFSIIGGLLTLILLPLMAALIKIDSPGPLFYRQKRVGRDNRILEIIKLRTMIRDAEKNGAQWAKEKDKRITKIGNFLRKARLDELPQMWNVLKGEMSFVGPRPERPEFAFSNELTSKIPFYQIRHTIKPGLTGWAQIKYPYGASVEDTLQKLQYDLYYIKNRSFVLDLAIVLKTIKIILSGGGR